MPTPIILASVIASWPIMWAIFGSAAVLVIALTTLVALATNPRHHARHAPHRPAAPTVLHETVPADRHALV
ncbi:MAG TPA: hypothetical protein VMA32_00980 [Streptosporangiaceae bacterium]|nr:hypothetical protein [Streptosporangiaceae bacterium]